MKDFPDLPLRDPAQVMQLSRLGCLHQTRLSFMRILTRRMAAEGWRVSRPLFEIDERGVGQAVYTVETGRHAYSLVAFAHDLPPEKRSDRVIAEAWDATFALFDGHPTEGDIARLKANVPLQEAGRIGPHEMTLSRANRSVRLWETVVAALAAGRQPDPAALAQVGYLMRTTAVYGSGKFGAADRDTYADRPEMAAPFQAEMLTVYLIRAFVRDLVNHAAKVRGGDRAVPLDDALATSLGIGNSTGLGMAPFLLNHPGLLNNWIAARETAIARIRVLPRATADEVTLFTDLLDRARADLDRWTTTHPRQARRVAQLRRDLRWLANRLGGGMLRNTATPWQALCDMVTGLEPEAQELIHSLMLEPYGSIVDDLAATLACPSDGCEGIDATMPVAGLRALLRQVYGPLLDLDWSAPDSCARAWYVSEEKLEPRLGDRHLEPVAEWEQPLAPARDAALLDTALADASPDQPVGLFLMDRPEHRSSVRRAQMVLTAPYAEIRDNTIAATLMPIDMLRCKLSFFGATRFDPRSDRWVRICMFAGAPYPEQLSPASCDTWVYPAPVPA